MIVTLDIFSGRPNPKWELSEVDAAKLRDQVNKRSLVSADATVEGLGYRGFVINTTSDTQLDASAPAIFRVGGAATSGPEMNQDAAPRLNDSESNDLVRFLLQSGRHVLDETLMAVVTDAIYSSEPGIGVSDAAPAAQSELHAGQEDASGVTIPHPLTPASPGAALPFCTIQNPPYNPAWWNQPSIQPHNNCYNYAMNYRSDTFAQPGRISGHMYTALDCNNVGTAASWDGCRILCLGAEKFVALVIWPGQDFHWYRRNADGSWSHKPGSTPVRNVDNSGRVINGTTLTPQNCNRGNYTAFCGYRYSPVGMKVK